MFWKSGTKSDPIATSRTSLNILLADLKISSVVSISQSLLVNIVKKLNPLKLQNYLQIPFKDNQKIENSSEIQLFSNFPMNTYCWNHINII